MLLTVLKQTDCFEVLDRENMEELRQELAMAGKDIKDVATAEYHIGGYVTSVKMESKSTSIGFGLIPLVGSVTVKKTTANLAMDIRLIDVNSTKILNTKTYEAQSGKTSFGVGGGEFIVMRVSAKPTQTLKAPLWKKLLETLLTGLLKTSFPQCLRQEVL